MTIEADIDRRKESGEISPSFAAEHLSFDRAPFAFNDNTGTTADLDHLHVLVAILPRPAHRVWFEWRGRRIPALLPPTYQRYRPLFEEIRRELAEVLGGATIRTVNLPLKQLAARMGLVRYGRTNVTYAPSIGSYLQIFAYITDAQLPPEARREPGEPLLIEECTDCGICARVCPTGAIDEERVLLHVERCLTLMNESPAPWPPSLAPWVHRCLVGCLACQQSCPANPPMPVEDTAVAFDEEQTRALLVEGEHAGPVWEAIRLRLETLGQPYQEPVLGRNLRALFRSLGIEQERAVALSG